MKTLNDLIALCELLPYDKRRYFNPIEWLIHARDREIISEADYTDGCKLVKQHLYCFT